MYGIESKREVMATSYGDFCMQMNLDDRIRELCAKAIAADDTKELDCILIELKLALHEHTERLRSLLSNYPLLHTDRINPDA